MPIRKIKEHTNIELINTSMLHNFVPLHKTDKYT